MSTNFLNAVTGEVVNAAVRIHMKLGPGLLESVYESLLARELAIKGLHIERQKAISIDFEGMSFPNAFTPDLIIENAVVVEVKSIAAFKDVHEKQLLTYIQLLDYRVGLLLNFGLPVMRDGIKRMVNNF
jgi:GxxExxY protein